MHRQQELFFRRIMSIQGIDVKFAHSCTLVLKLREMSPQIPTQPSNNHSCALSRNRCHGTIASCQLSDLLRVGTYRIIARRRSHVSRDRTVGHHTLVVAEMHVQYLLPSAYDDELTITTTVISAKGARIRHRYHVHRGTELLATGESVIAAVDPTGKVKRLTHWLLISHPLASNRGLISRTRLDYSQVLHDKPATKCDHTTAD